jgi:hypothetical protein
MESAQESSPADVIEQYLHEAIRRIDAQMGEGFSGRHPELVAAFVQACATHYLAQATGDDAARIKAAVDQAAHEIAHQLRVARIGI